MEELVSSIAATGNQIQIPEPEHQGKISFVCTFFRLPNYIVL